MHQGWPGHNTLKGGGGSFKREQLGLKWLGAPQVNEWVVQEH